MSDLPEFQPFPKLARLHREIVITEKIDGTNAQIVVTDDGTVRAASRKRGGVTRLLPILLLVSCTEGSHTRLPFNPHHEASDDLTIGVHDAAAHWGAEAYVLRQRRGTITISFDEPPHPELMDAVGWADTDHPCRPKIGLRDAWSNSWQVVAHEIGHVAGLEHHDDPNNIMYHEIQLRSVEYTERQELAVWALGYWLEACRG